MIPSTRAITNAANAAKSGRRRCRLAFMINAIPVHRKRRPENDSTRVNGLPTTRTRVNTKATSANQREAKPISAQMPPNMYCSTVSVFFMTMPFKMCKVEASAMAKPGND